MEELITIQRASDLPWVATLTINRASKRNALNQATVKELSAALDSLSHDDAVRVVILTGAGPVFSAGADLEALQALQTASRAENIDDSRTLADLFLKMSSFPKPIIGRINGHAIAGGAGLVAACDFAIGVNGARFGFTEVRIGFVPAIVMHFVSRRVGGRDLRDLFLSGRLIDASSAVSMGLLNDAVPLEELDMAVSALARELSTETSPEAIAQTKRLLNTIPQLPLPEALDVAVTANAEARETSDCKEGISAFLQKRPPSWKSAT